MRGGNVLEHIVNEAGGEGLLGLGIAVCAICGTVIVAMIQYGPRRKDVSHGSPSLCIHHEGIVAELKAAEKWFAYITEQLSEIRKHQQTILEHILTK